MNRHLLLLFLMLITAGALAGPVTVKVEAVDDHDAVALRNDRVALVIAPARGGAVTSYSDLQNPGELILQKPFNGLCLDHFQGAGWPGEFLEAPYEYEVVTDTPEEARVKVWRTAKNGILLEKLYTLRADAPALTCTVTLTAPADASCAVAYWLQNIAYAGGSYDEAADRLFRPTARGVRSTGKAGNGQLGAEDWIRDFSAGWMALIDTKKQTGLAMLTDYNELSVAYACEGNTTFEPMYNMVYLNKGQSRSYTVQLLPVQGMKKVLTVDPHLVLGYSITSDNKGNGTLQFTACRSVQTAQSVVLYVSLYGATDKKTINAGSVRFTELTDAPQTQALKFSFGPHDPLVVRVAIEGQGADGKPFTARGEDFFAGAYQWADNLTTDMRTPLYVTERPEQTLNLNKPTTLKITRHYDPQYLIFCGAFDDEYQVSDMMHMLTYNLPPIDVSYYSYNSSFYGGLTSFPYDYDKLLSYDCIVLGGVSKSGLKPIGVEMLHDYLLAGGNLIVLGSYGGYGRSRLKGTKLGDAMPVEFSDTPFDLQNMGGKPITMGPDTSSFLKDLKWSDAAACYWLHAATPKPGSKVLMQVDGKPFLVAGQYGPNKARILCLLGAPLGTPAKGQAPFWKDEMWPLMLKNALIWQSPWSGMRGLEF